MKPSPFFLSRLGLSGVCLKEEQLAAVKGAYEGQDVFVCLPTGYGKSRACVTIDSRVNDPAISNGARTGWK